VVHDSAGSVIPRATVALTNATTGYSRTLATDSAGAYVFLSVPTGDSYRIEVSATGFTKSVKEGITLAVNQNFRADFEMTVGQVSEQVVVSADSVQVDTTTNQMGDVINDGKMISLPLNGRSYTDLLGLQPGVVPITSSAAFTDRPVSGGLNAGGVSVNGSQESGNSFLINGGDVEEPKNSGASVIPSLDSIQEFRIVTNSFDAEYGRFGGAIVNVITKSGTNSLHGSVYEFLRNEKLNGKNYFDHNQTDPSTGEEIPNSARGAFKRNQFGFAFGGPIFKNHLFFFTDYQGTRQLRGALASTAFVPSTPEVTGDFSDGAATNFGALTGTVQGDPNADHTMPDMLTQRLGYTVTSGEPYWFQGCSSTSQCVFPDQKIPQAAWDSAAATILKFVPAPNGSSGATPFYSTSSLKNVVNATNMLSESHGPTIARGIGRSISAMTMRRQSIHSLAVMCRDSQAAFPRSLTRATWATRISLVRRWSTKSASTTHGPPSSKRTRQEVSDLWPASASGLILWALWLRFLPSKACPISTSAAVIPCRSALLLLPSTR
jgi:hypothetical protein